MRGELFVEANMVTEEKGNWNQELEERWLKTHPKSGEKKLNRNQKWHKEHPLSHKRSVLQRRAAQAKTVFDLTQEQEKEILSRDCFFCGRRDHLEIAHDIAVSKGGSTTRPNVFCACSACNSKQYTKSLAELLVQTKLPL